MDAHDLEQSELHDSTLSTMELRGSAVRLMFSNVLMSTAEDLYFRVTVELGGIREIRRDGQVVNEIGIEGEGASIINFKRSGDVAMLLLNWRHYSEKRNNLALYEFTFSTFHQQGELQDGFAG